MAGRVARIIAERLTDSQRNALKAVLNGEFPLEAQNELAALENYGLVKLEPEGESFSATLTEGGRAVAKAAFK